MNIRDAPDRHSFPHRDHIPANILTANLKCPEPDYSDRCTAFFTATFNTLITVLRSYEEAVGTNKVVEAWNNDMCEMGSSSRNRFFERLGKNYTSVSFW